MAIVLEAYSYPPPIALIFPLCIIFEYWCRLNFKDFLADLVTISSHRPKSQPLALPLGDSDIDFHLLSLAIQLSIYPHHHAKCSGLCRPYLSCPRS